MAKGRVCLLPLPRAPNVLQRADLLVAYLLLLSRQSPGPGESRPYRVVRTCEIRALDAGRARSVLIPAGYVMEFTADHAGRPLGGCSADGPGTDLLEVGEALQRIAAAVQQGRFEEVGATRAVECRKVHSPQVA